MNQYKRKGLTEARPYVPGEDVTGISIAEVDRAAGSPKEGDMIARNPDNPADQWKIWSRRTSAASSVRCCWNPPRNMTLPRPSSVCQQTAGAATYNDPNGGRETSSREAIPGNGRGSRRMDGGV